MSKYRYNIYQDVKEFFKENYDDEITSKDIDEMPKDKVLKYYLEWNGIFGYTNDIVNIMEAK